MAREKKVKAPERGCETHGGRITKVTWPMAKDFKAELLSSGSLHITVETEDKQNLILRVTAKAGILEIGYEEYSGELLQKKI